MGDHHTKETKDAEEVKEVQKVAKDVKGIQTMVRNLLLQAKDAQFIQKLPDFCASFNSRFFGGV